MRCKSVQFEKRMGGDLDSFGLPCLVSIQRKSNKFSDKWVKSDLTWVALRYIKRILVFYIQMLKLPTNKLDNLIIFEWTPRRFHKTCMVSRSSLFSFVCFGSDGLLVSDGMFFLWFSIYFVIFYDFLPLCILHLVCSLLSNTTTMTTAHT